MRKNWTHTPSASGFYGRLAGWLADEMRVEVEIFKLPYRLKYLDFYCLISVQCYYSVRNAFQSAFLKCSFLNVYFEARKIQLPFLKVK